MRFNTHSSLVGLHAFLGASKYHWINYSDEKLDRTYVAALASQRGTDLHAFAAEAIRLGVKLPKNRSTINAYVNDCIGWRMTPEQVLYYSDNAFGTADAISFRRDLLRISDLKTGATPGNHNQLKVYAAFFCLEYRVKPMDIGIELRIYQHDDVDLLEPDPDEITHIMSKVQSFDKRITAIRNEALS